MNSVRGTATGVTLACGSILMFAVTKSYINVERTVSIGGGFIMYGTITAVGLLILWQVLPETEGRTLEEIEQFFSDRTRKITDRIIRPLKSSVIASPMVEESIGSTRESKSIDKPVNCLDNPAFVDIV